MGGGRGDIEETLAAGRRLAQAGYRIRLYRRPGHPMPPSVDGPWDWPTLERRDRLVPIGSTALTITPAWGLSAAPSRPGPYGRGGPWEEEVADIETAYGPDRVLHVSLEEFARTLSTARENRERLREGGVSARALGPGLRAARRSGDVEKFRIAFRRFRAFDRPNVLHVFATFRPDVGFAREFPEAVQTGPLWPGRADPKFAPRSSNRFPEWVWYASPASAEGIAGDVAAGLASAAPGSHLWILTPRPWKLSLPGSGVTIVSAPVRPTEWAARFARAQVRIVTGSRTLLEAMELGGPFLYFNGTLGRGAHTRRHRPEKLASLLELATDAGIPRSLRRDLADFARGRRVREIVRRAVRGAEGWSKFPRRWSVTSFAPPYDDAGALLERVAAAMGRADARPSDVVRTVRSGLRP
ncbi:MAG: hypothetical protein L3K02_01515 [Thermoplasmata archaeon]|nr:hypothetical protein [Thermoplasmata archaeon]